MGILVFSLIKMISLQSETTQVNNMYQTLSEQAQNDTDTPVQENTEEPQIQPLLIQLQTHHLSFSRSMLT